MAILNGDSADAPVTFSQDRHSDALVPVSNKVRTSVSDKASSPRRGTDEEIETVVRLATRARGNGRNDRKQLRFPTLRRVYARATVDASTGEIVTKGASYYRDLWHYCQTWGFRILNDLQGAGLHPPEPEQLRDIFEARIRERAVIWHEYDGRNAGLESALVEALAASAAEATLRDWSAEWIASRREAGRKGGSFSKRPPSWDDHDLAVLALYAYLPRGEQLARYNAGRSEPRSRATLYRMLSSMPEAAPEPVFPAPEDDLSWELRWARLVADQRREERSLSSLLDGLVL